jgi:hypothetical protein
VWGALQRVCARLATWENVSQSDSFDSRISGGLNTQHLVVEAKTATGIGDDFSNLLMRDIVDRKLTYLALIGIRFLLFPFGFCSDQPARCARHACSLEWQTQNRTRWSRRLRPRHRTTHPVGEPPNGGSPGPEDHGPVSQPRRLFRRLMPAGSRENSLLSLAVSLLKATSVPCHFIRPSYEWRAIRQTGT